MSPLFLTAAFILTLGVAWAVFAGVRLGVHHRLSLILRPLSLERIPDLSAKRYRNRPLFTTNEPVRWSCPRLRQRYSDPCTWSAERIRTTAGYLTAMFLDRLGVEYGDRIAVMKRNHLDVHVITAAAVRAGGIACPINDRFAASKVAPYLTNVNARILVTDLPTLRRILGDGGGFGPVNTILLADIPAPGTSFPSVPGVDVILVEDALSGVDTPAEAVPRGPREPLYLVHSSGTTGFPKAVILRNGPQTHALRGWLCYVHVSRRHDKALLAVPNNHQAVILSFNSLLLLGLRVHWYGGYDRERFDEETVAEKLSSGGYTGFFGFPVTYTKLKELDFDRFDLSRMHFWAATADASHAVVERKCVRVGSTFRRLGIPLDGSVFLDAQGSSEVGTPSVIRTVTRFTRRFDRRVGRPWAMPLGPAVRVVKQPPRLAVDTDPIGPPHYPPVRSDAPLAPTGETGRLLVRGRTVFDGYWNHHTLTFRAFHDGWFFTGDIVRRGADGNLIQLDREVDVIRTATRDVYSLPMEEIIHEHPVVFDVCVYGERRDDGFQRPAAAIALRDGSEINGNQLLRELNTLLPESAQLVRLDILDWEEFPMGVTGKTLKRVFRERTEHRRLPEMNRPVVMATA